MLPRQIEFTVVIFNICFKPTEFFSINEQKTIIMIVMYTQQNFVFALLTLKKLTPKLKTFLAESLPQFHSPFPSNAIS